MGKKRQRITFKVRTDDATAEKFDLRFADNEDPARSFLLDGQWFGPGDWPRIESLNFSSPLLAVKPWRVTD